MINAGSPLDGRILQILPKNTHKRPVESIPWNVHKLYKYNICVRGNTREASLEMVRGRSSMDESTPQIMQKKTPKLTVESGQWRKLNEWQDATNTPEKHSQKDSGKEPMGWDVAK